MISMGTLTKKGRLNTVDLLWLNSLDELLLIVQTFYFFIFTKQAALMRRSTVLSHSLSLSVPWCNLYTY
jgi:hypothetical protein